MVIHRVDCGIKSIFPLDVKFLLSRSMIASVARDRFRRERNAAENDTEEAAAVCPSSLAVVGSFACFAPLAALCSLPASSMDPGTNEQTEAKKQANVLLPTSNYCCIS